MANEFFVLQREVEKCKRCSPISLTRTHTVFGTGPQDAEIVIVGEGPGEEEDKTGRVFEGPAGRLANRMLQTMGLRRQDVYAMNVVKCRACDVMPSGWKKNRTPTQEEASNCLDFFGRQMDLLRNKKLVITFGSPAAHRMLNIELGKFAMWKLRNRVLESRYDVPFIATYHPSYVMRADNAEKKIEVWRDLCFARRYLDCPNPDSTPEFKRIHIRQGDDKPEEAKIFEYAWRDNRPWGVLLPGQKDKETSTLEVI